MEIAKIFDTYFNGEKNFFTDKVYGYAKIDLGDGLYILCEKSEGEGLFGTYLYGCTTLIYDKLNNLVGRIDLSKAFTDKLELEKYIKSIDIETVKKADFYGELKKTNGTKVHTIQVIDENGRMTFTCFQTFS